MMIQAITAIIVAGLAAVVAITALRPHEDNSQLIVMVLGFLTPTLMAFLSLIRSTSNKEEINTIVQALIKPSGK